MKMDNQKAYVPVDCGFVDQIEILATFKKKVPIDYINEQGENVVETVVIKTWRTSEKEEFLITGNNVAIRLDRILSLNGIVNSKSCIT